jgi:hypothetical protein
MPAAHGHRRVAGAEERELEFFDAPEAVVGIGPGVPAGAHEIGEDEVTAVAE